MFKEFRFGGRSTWEAAVPTAWFLMAYIGTTVIAALSYVTPQGREMLGVIGVSVSPGVIDDIGTPLYFLLLLLPIIIVPVVSTVTAASLRTTVGSVVQKIPRLPINRATLVLMTIASFAYEAYQLHHLGALNLDVIACGDSAAKLSQRMSLLDDLGFPYFAFAYGMNMMLPILAYLSYEKQGHHKIDLALFLACLLGMVYFVSATYSKAPVMVFVIMLASAIVMGKSSIKHLAMVGAVCGISFVILTAGISASRPCSTAINSTPETTSIHQVAAASFVSKLLSFGVVQRMGSSFPFYIHMYKDPSARCGLQGIFRKSIGLPPLKCDLAVNVSKVMWPKSPVEGHQPAPASVSAFGELGFGWAVVVMVLTGFGLGLLGTVAAARDEPLFIAFGAAACGYAYYLTQVPFFGALTFPHGLPEFLAPIALLVVVALALRWRLQVVHQAANP